ncbi:hypothetical protein [Sphingobium subterraneum]|uniref:Uncharacterized protein n=1 Tax=Sphingobium subterraneum TaxID=627688 RepID=A0A841IY21_9SPHN|nr:hypothetical protein [Sphingobium subterraneum]MBB6123200.1 hypothetical protein [Sphingobium subterraneum]
MVAKSNAQRQELPNPAILRADLSEQRNAMPKADYQLNPGHFAGERTAVSDEVPMGKERTYRQRI